MTIKVAKGMTLKEAIEAGKKRREEELLTALTESLRLQAHYAQLLNMHDGGQRREFHTVDEWMARLVETGTIKREA